MRKLTTANALNEALKEEMKRDESVYLVGEDVALYHHKHGPCGVSTGLLDEFGNDRVIETPIAEQAIVGSSVGAAFFGMRPVVEIMHSEFLATCVEHVVYGGSKGSIMANGTKCPMVIRAPFGGSKQCMAVQNENNESMFSSTPGLKIVIPSNAYDAKGLLKSAIRDDYPILFFEHNSIYRVDCDVPEEEYLIPIGKADVKKEGSALSVIAYGNMVNVALRAAEELMKEGIDIEIVDLRTILPLDEETIINSVKKTKHAIVLHEARKTGGYGGEIVSLIMEKAFDSLEAPVIRIAGPDVPANYPRTEADVIKGVKSVLNR